MSADDVIRGWVRAAAGAAEDKQASAVMVLDVRDVLSITDWFVICDAPTGRQVKGIVEEVESAVVGAGGPKPRAVEGLDVRQWVLMDYTDFVVHVFDTEARRFYELERLWSDVPLLDWSA